MDQTIDYAAFPTTLLVIAALVATVVIIRFVIKTKSVLSPKPSRRLNLCMVGQIHIHGQ